MLKSLGGPDVGLCHVDTMEKTLALRHLKPLTVVPVRGVNTTKRLHGQEEDELEVRHTASDRALLQGSDETLSGFHDPTPICSYRI
jgi:hypothetical protein